MENEHEPKSYASQGEIQLFTQQSILPPVKYYDNLLVNFGN